MKIVAESVGYSLQFGGYKQMLKNNNNEEISLASI